MAHTSCFRREAGSAGRDTRGLLRVHEFDKVEILAYATPRASGRRCTTRSCERAESLIRDLGLTYRIVDICAGDLGRVVGAHVGHRGLRAGRRPLARGARRCRGSATTRPGGPTSATGRAGRRAPQVVHTLNGSALAVPRVWAALVETYRQPDGSIVLPDVLAPYLRGRSTIPAW